MISESRKKQIIRILLEHDYKKREELKKDLFEIYDSVAKFINYESKNNICSLNN